MRKGNIRRTWTAPEQQEVTGTARGSLGTHCRGHGAAANRLVRSIEESGPSNERACWARARNVRFGGGRVGPSSVRSITPGIGGRGPRRTPPPPSSPSRTVDGQSPCAASRRAGRAGLSRRRPGAAWLRDGRIATAGRATPRAGVPTRRGASSERPAIEVGLVSMETPGWAMPRYRVTEATATSLGAWRAWSPPTN